MFRSLIRFGVLALLFISLSSVPAQALPLSSGETGTWSLATFWERFIAPAISHWTEDTRGLCDPNGGNCASGATVEDSDTRGLCDPNGGNCNS
jgi:hypothetical protein